MKYLDRALSPTLRRAVASFPAVLVTGARQSGKTTLLRHEFERTHTYISLERPDVRARALSDPNAFFAENPPPLILDEIQYVPALLHHIKDRIDEDRQPGQWLLTGSQSFALMQGVTQSLAGRVVILSLDPLSVGEVLELLPPRDLTVILHRVFGRGRPRQSQSSIDLGDWLQRGGFPELRLNRGIDRDLWLSSYVQTYLERDVRDLVQVADLGSFERFLYWVAAHTGTVLNMSKIAGEVGVSAPTVRRWLSVLETSRVVYLLQPYHRNYGKRIVKSPKLYLLDVGLATFVLGLHTKSAILQGPTLGALVETAVVGEWIKAFAQLGQRPHLYFWRSSAGLEVDVVIEHDNRLYGIEVKAAATPTPRHAAALARWLELAGADAAGVLACQVPQPQTLRPGIRAVPWHLGW